MNISFFANAYYMGLDPTRSAKPSLYRGSSLIRGEQIAEALGGKYNPVQGYEKDVRIYLKPKWNTNIPNGAWIDVIDGGGHVLDRIKDRPDIKLIAYSRLSARFLKNNFPNKIIVIPEHHCNFERIRRTSNKLTTGGVVTSPSPLADQVYGQIAGTLKKVGLEFRPYYNYSCREDVVNFYKTIDFQVIGTFGYHSDNPFRHANKIINAASFGIPTIAIWMAGYDEFKDNYLPIQNLSELIPAVEKLKNKTYYDKLAAKIIRAAEPYHIEHISKLYKKLK